MINIGGIDIKRDKVVRDFYAMINAKNAGAYPYCINRCARTNCVRHICNAPAGVQISSAVSYDCRRQNG